MALKKFIEKHRGVIIIGTTIVILISALTTFCMMHKKSNIVDEKITNSMADNILSSEKNGKIHLYKTSTGKQIAEFDLKTLSTGKKVVKEKVIKHTVKESTQVAITNEEFYKGFKKVHRRIIKGDNDWVIQKKLTPNQNINKMVEMVKELNNKKSMDLIYPGEEYIFLAESNINTSNYENMKTKVIKKDEVIKEEKSVNQLGNNAVYKYSTANDFEKLYAYNDIENTFYEIKESKDKIVAKCLFTVNKELLFDVFRIENNNAYVYKMNSNVITKVNNTKDKNIKLNSNVKQWDIYNDNIYYIADNYLYKIECESGKESKINLGDLNKKFVIMGENILVYNSFGNGKDKSVIQKINIKDLSVEGWYELNSNENVVYTASNRDSELFISQVKKDIIENKNLLINLDINKLDNKEKLEAFKTDKSIISKKGFLYALDDNSIEVLDKNRGISLEKINIKGDICIPVD